MSNAVTEKVNENITQRYVDGCLVVGVKGRLTGELAKALDNHFLEIYRKGTKNLILDLRQVEGINICGIEAILTGLKYVAGLDFKRMPILLESFKQGRQLFEPTQFASLFRVYTSENEAVSKLKLAKRHTTVGALIEEIVKAN